MKVFLDGGAGKRGRTAADNVCLCKAGKNFSEIMYTNEVPRWAINNCAPDHVVARKALMKRQLLFGADRWHKYILLSVT